MRQPIPTIADQAPSADSLTGYDREHLVIYIRLLDAEADGADWSEVARVVLQIEPGQEPLRARVAAVHGRDALLFNVSAPDDSLRRNLCAAEVVHTMPSLAMLMDGLVQYLVSRKWRDYLVLQGPLPADDMKTKAFESSAKKFGARIAAHQNFKAGTDPREREQNDPALISAINRDYDVVFVADEAFDFVRQVPYHTVRPRPIVGGIDLEPVAWHWTWEHNGAPQVNSRFERRSVIWRAPTGRPGSPSR
jgi:ABC transporter substrate binding protein (PQQ-dependent alcohol dehydrogenase system)